MGYHVNSTPMFELISVELYGREKPCHVFCRIWATNAVGDTLDLYNREEGNPEFVSLNSPSLSLSRPKSSFVVPSSFVTVNVYLRDSTHGIEIVNGSFVIDYRNCLYTEEGVERVEGKFGAYALFKYATFPFAVVAKVEVLYFSDQDYEVRKLNRSCREDDNFDSDYNDNSLYEDSQRKGCRDGISGLAVDVSGSIIAKIKNQFPKNEESEPFFSVTLLDKPPKQCIKVKPGEFFELDRCVFAVPSYSRLKVCVNLVVHGSLLISGVVEFKPHDSLAYKKDIVGESGRIRVRVNWDNGYKLLNSCINLNLPSSALGLSGSVPPVVPAGDEIEYPLDEMFPLFRYPLAEVFSVAVFSNERRSCSVYGNIHVHAANPYPIFNRDASCPQDCSQFDTLSSLVFPSLGLSASDDFAISSQLYDENGDVISSACVSWNHGRLLYYKYLDKRICSILRGKTGFAAVHYSVFGDGIQCEVKVLLYESDPVNSRTKICGEIMAQYGSCSYTTSYEQKYYRSRLFKGDALLERDDCSSKPETSSALTIPLSKVIVSAPRYSSLVVEVNLTASPDADHYGTKLKGTLVFEEGGAEPEQDISMGEYKLKVLVQWNHTFV